MSDTPRTDAENCIRDMGFEKWVSIDFARELERELAAAIKQRDEARRLWCMAVEEIESGMTNETRYEVAESKGWDCFKEGGGA